MEILADLSRGYDRLVEVGSDIQVAFYPNGEVGLRHVCTRPRDGLTLRVAPKLQLTAGHTIVSIDPVTINPSCGCDDCGLHGFVRNSRWESC